MAALVGILDPSAPPDALGPIAERMVRAADPRAAEARDGEGIALRGGGIERGELGGIELYVVGEVVWAAGSSSRRLSPTEILEARAARGEAALLDLAGEFVLAFYDPKKRELSLATDRFGSARLYVSTEGARVLFATDLKAILRGVSAARLSPTGMIELLANGRSFGDHTWADGVRAVGPGRLLRFGERRIDERYFRPLFREGAPEGAPEEYADGVQRALFRAMRPRSLAERGVVLLDGGLPAALLGAAGRRATSALAAAMIHKDAKSRSRVIARQIGLPIVEASADLPYGRFVDQAARVEEAEVAGLERIDLSGANGISFTVSPAGGAVLFGLRHPIGAHRWTRREVIAYLVAELTGRSFRALDGLVRAPLLEGARAALAEEIALVGRRLPADEPLSLLDSFALEAIRPRVRQLDPPGRTRAPFFDPVLAAALLRIPPTYRRSGVVLTKLLARSLPELEELDPARARRFDRTLRRALQPAGPEERTAIEALRTDPSIESLLASWLTAPSFPEDLFEPTGLRAFFRAFASGAHRDAGHARLYLHFALLARGHLTFFGG